MQHESCETLNARLFSLHSKMKWFIGSLNQGLPMLIPYSGVVGCSNHSNTAQTRFVNSLSRDKSILLLPPPLTLILPRRLFMRSRAALRSFASICVSVRVCVIGRNREEENNLVQIGSRSSHDCACTLYLVPCSFLRLFRSAL